MGLKWVTPMCLCLHRLDRQLLEKSVEMRPVSVPWLAGSERPDKLFGTYRQPPPGAQLARGQLRRDPAGGIFREIERLETGGARRLLSRYFGLKNLAGRTRACLWRHM